MTTALIVDDEPKLINYLVVKLAKLWPELDVVGTAENGLEAVTLAQKLKPDIVFLDIKMPGLNGLAVAEMLPKHSKIVFVTAFDQYAADAFEQSAVDYLLKPVGEERLTKTIQRLKQKEPVAKGDLVALVIVVPDGTHTWLVTPTPVRIHANPMVIYSTSIPF